MKRILVCFVLLGTLISAVNAIDLTGSLFSHDPATITKEGDTYWHMYTAPGVGFKYSTDLTHWTSTNNHIFTPGASWKSNYPAWTLPFFEPNNNDGNIWAPDVIFMNGAYYLYYSCSSFGSSHSAIGVVKSSSLNDPSWTDLGMVVSSSLSTDINAIDPGLFRDDDGKVYMVYGSWHGGIGMVDIDTVTGLATSAVTHLYGGSHLATEAPALFKEGSYYYLVVNRGTCCNGVNSTYYIIVGRSTDVKGPYGDWRTLLPNQDGKYIGPGHFSLLRDSCNKYVSIHYYDESDGGRATLDILKLYMVDEWPQLSRNFFFGNCYDELVVDAGSNEFACQDTPYDLSSASTAPKVEFYTKISWDDRDATGSFDDSTSLNPMYTPPEAYVGDITLKLSATGIDTTEVLSDSMVLSIITNTVAVDAGSNGTTTKNKSIDLSTLSTPPSASNYNSVAWSDGDLGGIFSNKTVLEPIFYPPGGFVGDLTLYLTAYGDGGCASNDSLTITVEGTSVISAYMTHKGFIIYPNPVKNEELTISILEYISAQQGTCEIYAMDGKQIYEREISNTNSIQIHKSLPEGVYIVRFISGKHISTQKLIVN